MAAEEARSGDVEYIRLLCVVHNSQKVSTVDPISEIRISGRMKRTSQ